MKNWLLKSIVALLSASLLAVQVPAPAESAPAGGWNELRLTKDSDSMLFNGKKIRAAQPVTYKDGSAYIPLNGIAALFGFTLYYDVNTKESVAVSPNLELRFKNGSPYIKVNGSAVKGPGPAYAQNGYMMVPIRMWADLTNSRIDVVEREIIIRWSVQPKADFAVGPEEIYATQTPVVYTDLSSHPGGLRIVDERWQDRFDVFPTGGIYTITRWVMDENGVWSEPYSVTVSVRPPNLPPVADFSTDKTTYRIGERVTYIDRSTDDEDAIVRRTWVGNEPVFFEAGEKTVMLEVEDKHGYWHRVERTITVTDEVLYTKEEYDQLYTEVGHKYEVSGSAVLGYETIPYTFENVSAQMVRSNSPEVLTSTGIAYDTILRGKTRFLIYNQSALPYNVNLYLVATNISSTAVDIGVGAYGVGGPDPYTVNAGKMSTLRYLDAMNRGTETQYTRLRPKESVVLLEKELSAVPIKPQHVFSAYADIVSDQSVRYRVVVVPQGTDPLAALESLRMMPRDGVHVRGTFYNADREINIDRQLGRTKQRIVLGDNVHDPYLDGIDDGTGRLEWNLGNFGVLYRMKVNVAPNTLVSLNARGGHYTGAFIVNGRLVEVTKGSILKDQNEACVLYRTGSRAETVEFVFLLASGSNLPITMLFEPLPPKRD